MRRPSRLSVVLLLLAACSGGALEPVPVDTKNDTCGWCRMTVSDARTAAELLAPREEPKIFDDIGCLREYLAANPKQPAGSLAFVTDHRTGAWIAAERAVYTRVPGFETAMGSHLLAHADAASRAADPVTRGGEPLGATNVFGTGVLPVREPHKP